MAYCEIRGYKYYYRIEGQGEPLVMIRGLGSNADHWYAQIPALSRQYRLLLFDNPGIARTADQDGPYSISGMADDTVALMEATGFEKAHIVSLSMGGMIAQEIAINHPERVRGLVLGVTHCGGEKQVPPSEEVAEIFAAMINKGTDEAKIAAGAALFAPETLTGHLEIATRYSEVSLQYPVPADILAKQMAAVQGFDSWDRLPRISAPTLVLTADQDMLIPPRNSEILADRIPNAELVTVRGGGHQVMVEQPDACNEAILAFLDKR